jgi:hypothetical protein
MKHEICTCGHCRCAHRGGFQGCTLDDCVRYTWPGRGAGLPTRHGRKSRYEPNPAREGFARRVEARV